MDDTLSGCIATRAAAFPLSTPIHIILSAKPTFRGTEPHGRLCDADPDGVGWRYDVRRVAKARITPAIIVGSWRSCREAAARKRRPEILPGWRLCDGGTQRHGGRVSPTAEEGAAVARGGRAQSA